MGDCSKCKFCDKDYIFDPETGDEFPFYSCEKGHDTDLDYECKNFEEYRSKPYKEKDTECDKCEFLSECKREGNVIDCTSFLDNKTHYVCGITSCKKADRMDI